MTQVSHNSVCVCVCVCVCISREILSPHPTPRDRHRVPCWASCVTQQLPTSRRFYTWQSIYVNTTFLICPTLSCYFEYHKLEFPSNSSLSSTCSAL